MDLLLFVCKLLFFISSTRSYNFDTKNVISIVSNSLNDSYFGYSILLQKGSQPMVIVGAPRATLQDGGEVFSCSTNGKCFQYPDLVVNNNYTFVGNMMGAVIDGSENVGEGFVVCAYKKVLPTRINNYLKGYCVYKRNSKNVNGQDAILQPLLRERETSQFPDRTSYYNFGFAQAGFDIHYMKDINRVLMGAPGIATWSGGFVDQSLTSNNYVVRPSRQFPTNSETHGYLGYSVTRAYNNLYVIGAPRANILLGLVRLYDGDLIAGTLTGDEMGSYFGASILATDVNNDGVDDLFVGAPLGAGSTFDEGYVYYYGDDLTYSQKLVGSRKKGARFGTAIVALGDIDLDSFNDVAISAPYEDDVGAVYIYLGSKNGIQLSYSQRLSPKDFNGGSVRPIPKGFGLGISKGNDIDGNDHNDIAVGAYKSAQVFIVKGLNIIDYKLILRTDKESISDNFLSINYCITYTQRNGKRDLTYVAFKTNLQLDYRVIGQRNYEENWEVSLLEGSCKSIDLQIKQSVVDLTPFKIIFNATAISNNVNGRGNEKIEKYVPYVHGCGSDNICQTKIKLTTSTQTPSILLGTEQELLVNVIAENEGETGYQCQLHLNISSEIEPADKGLCKSENNIYICSFATHLTNIKEATIKFDVNKQMKYDNKQVEAKFEIKCLGVNLETGTSSIFFDINIFNSPYIVGNPEKENLFIDTDDLQDQNIVHLFTIGNFGPSPVKLDLILLMPLSKDGDKNLFEFVKAEGNVNGRLLSCNPLSNVTIEKGELNVQSVVREPINNTFALNCFQDSTKCLQIVCPGDYFLYRSNEIAIYKLIIKTNTRDLISRYNEEFKHDIMTYITSAFLFNSTSRIEGHTATLVYYSGTKTVALWIYIVALIIGLILLLLLSLILYKCHFFDRVYRDKMKDEKLMDQPLEIESSDTEKKDGKNDSDDH